MTWRVRAKMLLHVWSYDFYDMTLSTELQRRHVINLFWSLFSFVNNKEIWKEKCEAGRLNFDLGSKKSKAQITVSFVYNPWRAAFNVKSSTQKG